jgi:predicted transcriptional regulator
LGVSPEEYALYKQYKPQDSIIEAIKRDLKVEEVSSAEMDSRAALYAFKSVLDERIDKKVDKKNRIYDELDQPLVPAIDMLEEFEEEYGIDIEEMIDKANLAPDGRAEPEDIPYIQLYKEFLYKDTPEADYEDDKIKNDIFEEMAMVHSNELITSVGQRRENTLGFAIETFNKIQGKRAPLFYGE